MTSKSVSLWAYLLAALLLICTSCGGGSGNENVGPNLEDFDLFITADPDTGQAPLTVSFFAVPSGGRAPYEYAWDFNSDNVVDSNSPNGTFVYTQNSTATLTVTDASGGSVTTKKSIVITGTNTGNPQDQLDVRFNISPQFGNVPFNAQFTAYVSGGKEPYSYSWDFEGDGVYDAFIQNPRWTYETIGRKVEDNKFLYYPVLRVQDSRGVVGTNLDDKDNNGQPDFKLAINALPPEGGMSITATLNPNTGQAPLFVEFTGAVTGGSGEYEYRWVFGDGTSTEFSASSLASHTYVTAGQYFAVCHVHDTVTNEQAQSLPLAINAVVPQPIEVTITSDVAGAQVPFVVNFQAKQLHGQEPIIYRWDVFDDATPADDDPSVGAPPALDAAAVVTPDFSLRKNPTIHFGNTAGEAEKSYVVRCVVEDAVGNTAVSNLIRVVATPNTTYPYYEAHRPMVVAETVHPSAQNPMGNADAEIQPLMMPQPWGPRANAAVCGHPTGISFIIGGEILDENGNFDTLLTPGDTCYAYVPATAGTATGEQNIGRFQAGMTGVMIRLSDSTAPPFPNSPVQGGPWQPPLPIPPNNANPALIIGWGNSGTDWDSDTTVPPQVDPDSDGASAPGTSSLRSAPFVNVGSAAAVFIHEPPETNPAGAYPPAGTCVDSRYSYPDSIDRDIIGWPSNRLWIWPDGPVQGWGPGVGT